MLIGFTAAFGVCALALALITWKCFRLADELQCERVHLADTRAAMARRLERPVRREPTAWFERTLKKKVVLHLKNDQSIQGALMEQTLDGVILRAAELLGNDGKKTSMAGETFVPRENIAFSQLDE